jgi:hypothetical protein
MLRGPDQRRHVGLRSAMQRTLRQRVPPIVSPETPASSQPDLSQRLERRAPRCDRDATSRSLREDLTSHLAGLDRRSCEPSDQKTSEQRDDSWPTPRHARRPPLNSSACDRIYNGSPIAIPGASLRPRMSFTKPGFAWPAAVIRTRPPRSVEPVGAG